MEHAFDANILRERAGKQLFLQPNYILIDDGQSAAAIALIDKAANPDRLYVFFDHNVPTGSPEAAEKFGKLLRFSRSTGAQFMQAKGIGCSYMLQTHVQPGDIVLSGGMHPSLLGGIGALGLHACPAALAEAVVTGNYAFTVPETVSVQLVGELPAGCSAMDVGLHLLHTVPGLEGKALALIGEQLSSHEKSVVCSMASLRGAITAAFVDQVGNAHHVLELSQVQPMVMHPCSEIESQHTAKITLLNELGCNLPIHAGQISGYTGGTIEALRIAAGMIAGKQLRRGFRLSICPATSADYIAAMEEGLMEAFIDYGAQIHAVGDRSIVRQGAGVMGPGERLLTTGLYTFSGCMGCDDAQVYTASVPSVIAASMADAP